MENSKIKIVFCHNVYDRFNTLYETIKIEKTLFPNSHSVIAYNNENPEKIFSQFNNIDFIKYDGITHKIGCANGCIASIKHAIEYDPDVIVFSHDDVMLNPIRLQVFENNIESIVRKKHDVICRKPDGGIYGNNYYLMEVFFISGIAAKQIFKDKECFTNELEIARDVRGSISPEVFLYNTLKQDGINVYELKYYHTLINYNETLSNLTGFYHKNAGERGWKDL